MTATWKHQAPGDRRRLTAALLGLDGEGGFGVDQGLSSPCAAEWLYDFGQLLNLVKFQFCHINNAGDITACLPELFKD